MTYSLLQTQNTLRNADHGYLTKWLSCRITLSVNHYSYIVILAVKDTSIRIASYDWSRFHDHYMWTGAYCSCALQVLHAAGTSGGCTIFPLAILNVGEFVWKRIIKNVWVQYITGGILVYTSHFWSVSPVQALGRLLAATLGLDSVLVDMLFKTLSSWEKLLFILCTHLKRNSTLHWC